MLSLSFNTFLVLQKTSNDAWTFSNNRKKKKKQEEQRVKVEKEKKKKQEEQRLKVEKEKKKKWSALCPGFTHKSITSIQNL